MYSPKKLVMLPDKNMTLIIIFVIIEFLLTISFLLQKCQTVFKQVNYTTKSKSFTTVLMLKGDFPIQHRFKSVIYKL